MQKSINIPPHVKQSIVKPLLLFLLFQLVFSAVTAPFLIFYGPFGNVKRSLVGASWNTLEHQYIAKFFLSDLAIEKVLQSSYAIDPLENGEEIQMLNLTGNYSDDIQVYNINGPSFNGKLMTVSDPLRIEIGYSSQMPQAGETTSVIAKKNGAIAAINAGGFTDANWTGTGGNPMGFLIHNGKVIYTQIKGENVKQDTAAFTDKGMLIVGRHSLAQLKNFNVKEAITFGPPLVVNGKPTITKGDGGWGIAPRTALGQRIDGAVLLLVVDGRNLKSLGASLKDIQDIMLKFGAVNAVNLDGGSSTTMYFNGKIINTLSDALGERAVPSTFMVMPMKEGG